MYFGGKAWTELQDRWLCQQRFDALPAQAAFDDAYETVVLATARRARLDDKIIAPAGDSEFTAVTRRLACLRGISTLTGACVLLTFWVRRLVGSVVDLHRRLSSGLSGPADG